MKQWTASIVDRLEAAYRARFDREMALIFLNDAYQDFLILRTHFYNADNQVLLTFLKQFTATRDLFVSQVVDRYPSNYNEVEIEINKLKELSQQPALYLKAGKTSKASFQSIA